MLYTVISRSGIKQNVLSFFCFLLHILLINAKRLKTLQFQVLFLCAVFNLWRRSVHLRKKGTEVLNCFAKALFSGTVVVFFILAIHEGITVVCVSTKGFIFVQAKDHCMPKLWILGCEGQCFKPASVSTAERVPWGFQQSRGTHCGIPVGFLV